MVSKETLAMLAVAASLGVNPRNVGTYSVSSPPGLDNVGKHKLSEEERRERKQRNKAKRKRRGGRKHGR